MMWMAMYEVRNNDTILQAPTFIWAGLDIPLFSTTLFYGDKFFEDDQ